MMKKMILIQFLSAILFCGAFVLALDRILLPNNPAVIMIYKKAVSAFEDSLYLYHGWADDIYGWMQMALSYRVENLSSHHPRRSELVLDAFKWREKVAPFNCSRYIQKIYRKHGVLIPGTTYWQWKTSQQFATKFPLPGDVVYIGDEMGRIVHCGFYLNKKEILHASERHNKVIISNLKNFRVVGYRNFIR